MNKHKGGPIPGRRNYNPHVGEPRQTVHVRVPISLHGRITALANERGLSVAGIAVELLDLGLNALTGDNADPETDYLRRPEEPALPA